MRAPKPEVVVPGPWLRFKAHVPRRLLGPFAILERRLHSRRGLTVYLDGHPIQFVLAAAPAFRSHSAAHEEEREFLSTVLDTLGPAHLFLDVGSHVGLYAMGAAVRMGPSGHVIAFEPTPETADRLAENVRLNSLSTSIELHRIAVSEGTGTVTFTIAGTSMMNSMFPAKLAARLRPQIKSRTVEVPTQPLDDFYAAGRNTTVKIDTEGAEILVLRGAPRILASEARIFVELHPWTWGEHDGGWEELVAVVGRAGRVMCTIDGPPLEAPRHCRVELVRCVARPHLDTTTKTPNSGNVECSGLS